MKLLLTFLLSFALLAPSCSSSKQEESEAMSEEEAAAPAPAPAPSTAIGSALVKACEESDDHYRCTLTIQQMDGYGANTPPLPVGTDVDTLIPKSLLGEDAAVAEALLAPGKSVAVTLRHKLVPSTEGETPPAWRVVKIE